MQHVEYLYSNTTFVKVKLKLFNNRSMEIANSNTTFVKVKWKNTRFPSLITGEFKYNIC